MPSNPFVWTAVGLAALASPALAQDFYVGAALASGTVDYSPGISVGDPSIQSAGVLGGIRFDMNSGLFLGAEVQTTNGNGYADSYTGESISDSNRINQAEVHVGYVVGSTRFFGFFGTGHSNFTQSVDILSASDPAIFGVGAEFSVTERMAVRLEAEFSTMAIEDGCCGIFDPVERNDVTAGIIFSF